MKHSKIVTAVAMAGLMTLLISGNAAASFSFNFETGSKSGGTGGLTFTSGGMSVTATGWSNTNASWEPGGYGSGTLVQRDIYRYWGGGLGVTSPDDVGQGSPEHATDNQYRIDSILLDFGKKVTLSQVSLGYAHTDSDLTIAAFTGAAGNTDLSTMSYSQMIGSGWEAIGNYSNVGTANPASVNGGEKSSSLWLISALNPELKATGWTIKNDFFKLGGVGGTVYTPPQTIPEPTTLMLLGCGLLMIAMRRRYMQNREVCAIKA